jgi:hypothetical protein
MVSVTEETPYLSGLLATVTVMTLMTLSYGLILDSSAPLLYRVSYCFNVTRRAEQGVPYLCDL